MLSVLSGIFDDLGRPTQKKMFGGVAYFTPTGNMCFAMMKDELLFRVGKEQTAVYLGEPGIREARMGSRVMKNWLLAGGEAIEDEKNLQRLLQAGYDFAMSLPPKE